MGGGGCLYRPSPPTQKVGGGGYIPHDLRQCMYHTVTQRFKDYLKFNFPFKLHIHDWIFHAGSNLDKIKSKLKTIMQDHSDYPPLQIGEIGKVQLT